MSTETEPQHEAHCLTGEQLLEKVRELVREGRVRHLILKDEHGRTLLEVPLALGVVGVLLAPVWAALAAVAALATHVTLVVVRDPEAAPVTEKSEEGKDDSRSPDSQRIPGRRSNTYPCETAILAKPRPASSRVLF